MKEFALDLIWNLNGIHDENLKMKPRWGELLAYKWGNGNEKFGMNPMKLCQKVLILADAILNFRIKFKKRWMLAFH